ncbi:MAG: thioredoxin family protein [Sphingomonadales bacterium]|nr:thioredoxin family protein [Sphingomonadales bacterium]MBD3772498.1 thioredoxin family protein [Paracoccaceae bacterium]
MTVRLPALLAVVLAAMAMFLSLAPAARANNIASQLVVEAPPQPGKVLMVALAFEPGEGWHGYWSNPGDAGYGMELTWDLPPGWSAGEPIYPVPQPLLLQGLMNHVYEGPYAVLVPVTVPAGADVAHAGGIAVEAQWLACTDKICVPEQARLLADLPPAGAKRDARFDAWRAAIPPPLDQPAHFAVAGKLLRIAIPFPASATLDAPHIFIRNTDLVQYAAPQKLSRAGDMLVAEIPLLDFGGQPIAETPAEITGILALGEGNGVSFAASPGAVPVNGKPIIVNSIEGTTPPLWTLILAALAGGLLLNIMPCVFPILSLKALSLARAGESEAEARREGLAYTAGAIIACLALGGVLLALRAGGEEIGWAFQLQEPGVVVGLLVLALAITANFAGLFELPTLAITREGKPSGAFTTGVLAAFVATPCTGPFMAAALGAALLLPTFEALALFGSLGLGLALPFLLVGLVPALRKRLPRPGPWMNWFRKLMAVPMALTALALAWLSWRIGGVGFAIIALAIGIVLVALLAFVGRAQHAGKPAMPILLAGLVPLAVGGALALPPAFDPPAKAASEGLLGAQPFSEAALANARASGKPVFLYFTADWCLTCKVNENIAIDRAETKAAFDKAGVIVMVGDWTRRDAEITRFLGAQGAAGVPLYLWYAPGKDAEQLPQVLTSGDLTALAQR